MNDDEFSKHFKSFFIQLKNKNGRDYKGGTIRTSFGSLIAFIHEKTGKPIDINKDKELYSVLNKKLRDLAAEGKDETNHAKPLSEDQVNQVNDSFDKNTPMGLLSYVYFNIARYCASRGGHPYTILFEAIKQHV